MNPRPARDKRFLLVLLLVLLACGVLGAQHLQSERHSRMDRVTGGIRDWILMPAQTGTVRLSRWWRAHVLSSFQGAQLARQNAVLQAQILTLANQNKQLLAAQDENIRLRALLGFAQKSERPLLAAEVVALKPDSEADTLTLNRGSLSGVHRQSVVIAPNGALVGQVLDVSPRTCSVLMLTDPNSSVGGQVNGRGSHAPVGVCQGDRSVGLRLTYLPSDADVRNGDSVTTSGLGGIFPKNLPIGTVRAVTVDRTRSIKTAQVRPAADMDHLDEAFILQ